MRRISSLSDEHRRAAFRLALFVCVLAISYLAFAPPARLPDTTPGDKLSHGLAFAALAWLADMSYPGRYLAMHRWTLLLGYGLFIELVQGFLPYRDLSLFDFVADAAGILCYSMAAWIYARTQYLK